MNEAREEASTSAPVDAHDLQQIDTTSTSIPTVEETGPSLSIERDRSPFSYDSSQLRRRHPVASITQDEPGHDEPKRRASMDHSTAGGFYECNICFDTATHPVVTLCGHLFCWSCLAQWLHHTSRNPTCPVCKAGCGKDKVVPVYGRGREQKDPREDPTIPSRPPGQRPAPLRDPNSPHFFGGPMRGTTYSSGNFAISAGFGVFPGLFGVTFNLGAGRSPHAQAQQDAFMSRLFLMIGALLLITIVFCC